MSSRRPRDAPNETATRLRNELESLKTTAQQVEVAGAMAEQATVHIDANQAFDNLTGAEQAAGSLGVHPEAWKPIKFMNNRHYAQLIASNALDDNLARRIEAFRHVATSNPAVA